jgi:type I restriction enzyme S subunit
MVTNQGFRSLILSDDLDPFFIRYYVLLSRKYLEEHASGTTFKELSGSALGDLLFPVPPLDVQHRIVARIDELFTDIDDGEAALARARDDLATWRKALLKSAVTGELTASWRAANPPTQTGTDLLARILSGRLARWTAEPKNKGKRYKDPAPFSGPVPRELPTGWVWASVEQIGDVITGNTPPANDRQAYNGDVPFFTPGDLDAGFALDGTRRTLGPSGLARSREVPPRSVLVTCIGATVGKVGFNAKAGATNQQINTIIPAEAGMAEFLFHYFDGPGRQLVVERASSTTMPIINKGDFSRLPVPVPPLAEAMEISRTVKAMVSEAEIGRVEMTSIASLTATLRQSVLAAAFRGELA